MQARNQRLLMVRGHSNEIRAMRSPDVAGCNSALFARFGALVLLLGLCHAPIAIAATLIVPDDYPTISAAYAASGPWGGDTILLRPGTYEGGLVITKYIRIEGDADASAVRLLGGVFAVAVDGNHLNTDVYAEFHDITFVASRIALSYDGAYGTLVGASITNCVFDDATLELQADCRASVVGNLFLGGGSKTAIAIDFFEGAWGHPGAYVTDNTVVGYDKFIDAKFRGEYSFQLENNIIAHCNTGITCNPITSGTWSLRCNDVFDCDVRYAGFTDRTGVDGNISRDPQFCGEDAREFSLQASSPCLPGNHPDAYECGLIGLMPVGCEAPVATEAVGWGSLKSRFR